MNKTTKLLQCKPIKIEYDFKKKTLIIHLKKHDCVDMEGAIELAEMFDENVKQIITFGGKLQDTVYFKEKDGWDILSTNLTMFNKVNRTASDKHSQFFKDMLNNTMQHGVPIPPSMGFPSATINKHSQADCETCIGKNECINSTAKDNKEVSKSKH